MSNNDNAVEAARKHVLDTAYALGMLRETSVLVDNGERVSVNVEEQRLWVKHLESNLIALARQMFLVIEASEATEPAASEAKK